MADDNAFAEALHGAVSSALLRHKQTGLPIVASVGGKVTRIPAAEIIMPEALTEHER